MARDIALTLLLTILPISELRGGIPLGISLGLDPLLTLSMAVVANALMFFPIFFGLRLFYDRLLSRIPFFDRYLDNVRRRGKPKVDKYGFWGLMFLVALPLPITGVYTGTSLAWLLGMDWRKAFPAALLGVTIAGVVVFLITMGVIRAT
ncbi:MAG: COG2426 family protein [Dehalococcoidia bacterium]